MRNYDAWILFAGFVMFVVGWIASSINYNHRIKTLKAEIEEIKIKSNEMYTNGWYAGYDFLAANTEIMRTEVARADKMRRIPRNQL